MVIMIDELSPLAHWPLAIVMKIHPGNDGLVRVVTIKTAQPEFIRPIAKLTKLPLDDSMDEGDIARITDTESVTKPSTTEFRPRTI